MKTKGPFYLVYLGKKFPVPYVSLQEAHIAITSQIKSDHQKYKVPPIGHISDTYLITPAGFRINFDEICNLGRAEKWGR